MSDLLSTAAARWWLLLTSVADSAPETQPEPRGNKVQTKLKKNAW
jgi:hypothetical protein